MTLTLEVDLPADLARFQLPAAVAARLQGERGPSNATIDQLDGPRA